MKKLLVVLLASTLCPVAFAGLSQLGVHFSAQNANVPATNVTSPFTSDVITVYATENPQSGSCGVSNMTYTLKWIDERQILNIRVISTTPGKSASMVVPMRVYGEPATIQSNGVFSLAAGTAACVGTLGAYGLYVDGFGFWPGQPQKQAGILEPAKFDYTNITSQLDTILDYNMGGPGQESSYLVFVLDQNIAQNHLQWNDEYGPQSADCSAGCIVPFRGHGEVSLSNIGFPSGNNRVAATAIKFAVPGNGSGPLTDYEFSAINSTFEGTRTVATVAMGTFYAAFETISTNPLNPSGQYIFSSTLQTDSCGLVSGVAGMRGTGVPSYISGVCPTLNGGAVTATMTDSLPKPSYDVYDDLIVF